MQFNESEKKIVSPTASYRKHYTLHILYVLVYYVHIVEVLTRFN